MGEGLFDGKIYIIDGAGAPIEFVPIGLMPIESVQCDDGAGDADLPGCFDGFTFTQFASTTFTIKISCQEFKRAVNELLRSMHMPRRWRQVLKARARLAHAGHCYSDIDFARDSARHLGAEVPEKEAL